MACDRCHGDLDTGDHGIGFCPLERGAHRKSTIDVTWAGGKVFENVGHTPQTFYSPAEKAKYLKAHGLEEFVRHQPVPGSDKSPHTTSWAGISQYSLDAAKSMLERPSKATQTAVPDYLSSMTVTVTEVTERVTGEKGVLDVVG